MSSKWTSRKFWMAVAAFLASIGGSITGFAIAEPWIAAAGLICTVLSAAIYQAIEAYVDGASIKSNSTSKVITANTDSASIVKNILQPTDKN